MRKWRECFGLMGFFCLLLSVKTVIASPQLIELKLSKTEEGVHIEASQQNLHIHQEYVFLIHSELLEPVFLETETFGQHVSTLFLHGTGNVSQHGMTLLPQENVTWQIYTRLAGQFQFWGNNPNLGKKASQLNIAILDVKAEAENQTKTTPDLSDVTESPLKTSKSPIKFAKNK